jgi:hypothetical protein
MALNAWVLIEGFSTYNSSFLLNSSRTTLSWHGLWINSASNSAKVLCHFNYFAKAFGCVSKYHKETLFVEILVLCIPK